MLEEMGPIIISIQDAIDAAGDGDTIIVYPAIYKESIIINKNLSLLGKTIDGKKAIMNGGKNNFTLEINKSCLIKNFDVLLEKYNGIAVRIFSPIKFLNNTIETGFNGTAMLISSPDVLIKYNEIYEINYGIQIKNCSYCHIHNNIFHDVNDYCIFLSNSSNCDIHGNKMENIRWKAIQIFHSTKINISNNTIKGIEMLYSNNNTVFCNNLSSNRIGFIKL